MAEYVVSVLTYKSVETILKTGGTQSWVLDKPRAKACKYVVVCRNARTRDAEGPEPHGSAFMVGKIKDVVPSTENDGRWLILLSEFALCNSLDQWEGRNPVAYWTTDDYKGDIDFDTLMFTPMPNRVGEDEGISSDEAKVLLARKYKVPESAIEIMIRW